MHKEYFYGFLILKIRYSKVLAIFIICQDFMNLSRVVGLISLSYLSMQLANAQSDTELCTYTSAMFTVRGRLCQQMVSGKEWDEVWYISPVVISAPPVIGSNTVSNFFLHVSDVRVVLRVRFN